MIFLSTKPIENIMDFIHYILVYLLTVIPVTAAIFVVFRFFLKMREWFASDWIMLVIPGAIYFMMEKLRPDKLIGMRMLENIDAPIVIGILCALIFMIRCFSARKRREDAKKFSYLSVIVMTIATILILMVAPPFTNQ
jgi:hypothetical protein